MGSDVFLVNMGERIAQRRKELGLTQEQLAEQVGLSLQSISCIELGKKAARPENLVKICNCLDVTSDYLLYGRRNEQLIHETVSKLSALSPESYRVVKELITLLYDQEH